MSPPEKSDEGATCDLGHNYAASPIANEVDLISTLTIEIAHTRRLYKGRPKSRRETYTVGYGREYDLFSFCCYRAMLLGSPAYISQAFLDGARWFLPEILKPQKLLGEEKVEDMLPGGSAAPSFCYAITFKLSSGWFNVKRDIYGHRFSHGRIFDGHRQYGGKEAIIENGAPPTFFDANDFRKKSQLIGGNNQPMTEYQAWDTWFWLLLNTTAYRPKKNMNAQEWHCMDAPRQAGRKPSRRKVRRQHTRD